MMIQNKAKDRRKRVRREENLTKKKGAERKADEVSISPRSRYDEYAPFNAKQETFLQIIKLPPNARK